MGNLYVVATPIGNLEDITYRAIRILREVDLICCEDTRHTKILLDRYKITKPLVSYHQHSKLTKIDYIISQLQAGKNIALVSDAGTPGINDPGGVLVSETIKQCSDVTIVPIPGLSAVITLLSVSGMPADKFLFLGFLPKKKGRQTLVSSIKYLVSSIDKNLPIVIYESPYRIIKTLEDFSKIGSWQVIVGRELTKKFEEIVRGDIKTVTKYFTKKKPKGEFVVCLKRE